MLRHLATVIGLFTIAPALLAQGFTPDEAVKRMKLPDGFSVRCVASEPMIRQPLSISFDTRGRLWVLQYLQYPNPAGLKPVKQDQYLRTTWDKVPEAPPKGPKGLDKITICSDPDENGVFRKSKDFVSGLNLAHGFCIGNGGVYVVQPPYLLFYPDKNEDDVPDGDPEVLLSGFGLDDTHSLANSLQWGPDGWLYGAAGSTSTSRISVPLTPRPPLPRPGEGEKEKKPSSSPLPSPEGARGRGAGGEGQTTIEFQQGLWRYHPKSKQFELFSEGGGNTYGLDFDRHGNAISGTNWGGFAMLHQMQGAYYVKGFSKHGPLHNPHAYGYFDHVPYKNFKGGHVTCGGILYEADVYPKEFRHQYIAGNLLSNAVHWHKMTPKGASFTAEHGGELLEANDTWFRPVDLTLGADGCVYVADWYDKRAAHLDPIDTWDKTNGRVYKIEYHGERRDVSPPVVAQFDLRKKSNAELLELLKHPNVWWRREARRLLAERPADKETLATLTKWVKEEKGQLALEALWAWWGVEGEPDGLSGKPKLPAKHANEHVRAWAIRLFGDAWSFAGLNDRLGLTDFKEYTRAETSPVVLAQIACSTKRLFNPRDSAMALRGLVENPFVANDLALRHLVWWGFERVLTDDPHVGWVVCGTSPTSEHQQQLTEQMVRRLIREERNPREAHEALADYIGIQYANDDYTPVVKGLVIGLREAGRVTFQERLGEAVAQMRQRVKPDDPLTLEFAARLGDADTIDQIELSASNYNGKESDRLWAFQLLRTLPGYSGEKLLLNQIGLVKTDPLRLAVLDGLQACGGSFISDALLKHYSKWSTAVQKRAIQVLLSRPKWALALFQRHADGTFPKGDLTVDHARAAVALNDPELTKLVEKQFGKVTAATAGEKRARIDALNAMLGREKPGDPAKGQTVFEKNCAACHQLFGSGTKVGPDLTSSDRKNRYSLLTNTVDPSGHIRPEFLTHVVNTHDGRTYSGVVTEQSPEKITLANYVNNKVETTTVARKEIDKLDASAVSLMPEKLLDTMSEEEIRDLFAHVMQDPPPKAHGQPSAGEKQANPDRKGGGDPKKLKVALISGSLEYKSDDTLPVFQKLLEDKYPVECVRLFRKTDEDVPGLDKLAECDLAIFFTRRLKIDGEQLKAVKAYCESGKPVIGIRTASHGFQNWLEMDKDVFGGNYKGHFGAGPKCDTAPTDAGKDHPILKDVKPFASEGSLYKNPDLPKGVTVLLTGTAKENVEPIAWVRERKVGEKTQRVFYTSLGHPKDFEEEAFTRMLRNAIGWCAQDERFGK